MKEIKAIIQPFMLDKVIHALQTIENLPGCIVSKVETFGRVRKGKGATGPVQRTKLEIVVHDQLVSKVVETIQKNAHTGNKGDGKVFVIECTDVVRIRTGEHGDQAV